MGPREKLLEISSMQQWNGSFILNDRFGQCFGVNKATLDQDVKKNGWNADAYASVVALVYLQKKLDSLKDDWELIADKTRNWLLNNYRSAADDMYEAAVKIV